MGYQFTSLVVFFGSKFGVSKPRKRCGNIVSFTNTPDMALMFFGAQHRLRQIGNIIANLGILPTTMQNFITNMED